MSGKKFEEWRDDLDHFLEKANLKQSFLDNKAIKFLDNGFRYETLKDVLSDVDDDDSDLKVGFFGGKFLPLHVGHIRTLIQAATEVDKLYFILFSSKRRDLYFCNRDGIRYMPPEERLRWMGEVTSDLDMVEVLHIEDDNQGKDHGDHYDWEAGTQQVKDAIPEKITHIYGGQDGYPFEDYYDGVRVVMLPKAYGISATRIRQEGVYKNWRYLPPAVRRFFVLKVALIGTESCGKSTLTKMLAKIYNTNYVDEIGRRYCEERKDQLTPELFDHIAFSHIMKEEEQKYLSNRVLFIDTEAVVTYYYLDMYFSRMSGVIKSIIDSEYHNYDVILYLRPDVKWVDDGLRLNYEQEEREALDKKLRKLTEAWRNTKLHVLEGSYSQRLESAIDAISMATDGEILPVL